MYWYSWAYDNWGTKWNSYDCSQLNENTWEFSTAWYNVNKLIKQMADQFPDVKIVYEYADEDIGYNCGVYNFFNNVIDENVLNGSKEAYELAFKLHPNYIENYEFNGTTYVYKERN